MESNIFTGFRDQRIDIFGEIIILSNIHIRLSIRVLHYQYLVSLTSTSIHYHYSVSLTIYIMLV